MGYFNGRVGPRRTLWETYFGPHYNGEQLPALCTEHGLWITDTFFYHRPSQRQTWHNRNYLRVSFQIDFILTRANDGTRRILQEITMRECVAVSGERARNRDAFSPDEQEVVLIYLGYSSYSKHQPGSRSPPSCNDRNCGETRKPSTDQKTELA